ncbi:phosphatase PAP2 family protein [Chromatiaceae bacterium AAb-1]|jgi:undecaprenyl-diphosphatase|nr:phosphatase PAP2 family protein [Chromatiaceae bacterium AAb-1]
MLLKRLEQWDHYSFSRLFNRSSSAAVFKLSYWVSKSGDGPLYVLLVALLMVFGVEYATDFTILLLTAFALELPLYLILKNSIKRCRPADVLTSVGYARITPSDRFSLPSGHTAAAFVITTAIAVYYPVFLPFILFWACCVGLSRILLGVHFPLDIIAGALLGISCTITAFLLLL